MYDMHSSEPDEPSHVGPIETGALPLLHPCSYVEICVYKNHMGSREILAYKRCGYF